MGQRDHGSIDSLGPQRYPRPFIPMTSLGAITLKKMFALAAVLSSLAGFVAQPVGAQEIAQGGMIEIGGAIEAGRQVTGPELGTVVGLEIYGKNTSDPSVTFRYFWVKGQVMIGQDGLPVVDLRIIPFATLSVEEQNEVTRRMNLATRLLPVMHRRDVFLGVERETRAFLGGVTVGGEWDLLASKDRSKAVTVFGELAIDAIGVAYASASLTGADYFRIPLVEAGGRVGLEARLQQRFALQITAFGMDGYTMNAKARVSVPGEGDIDGYGIQLRQIYSEIALAFRATSTEFAVFARTGKNTVSESITLTAPTQAYDMTFNDQSYRYLRVGVRASFR